MVRGARRAAHRTGGTARRAAHSTSRGLDHLTAATQRGRAAARAARTTAKDGGTARDAGKAARATLKNSRRPPVRGAWRRSLGETAWWVGGWGLNLLLRGLWWSRNQFQLYPAVTDGDEPARERIDSKADRPTNPSAGGHNGGSEMAKKGGGVPQFVHAADELAEAFRRYEPPPGPGGMVQMYSDMGMLPDALETIAGGFALFADRARSQLPLHPAVIDFIDELAKIQATMASVSAEIKPAIEKLHDKDLDRHRAPRQGEHMWDVG